jgi:hypothetical protein
MLRNDMQVANPDFLKMVPMFDAGDDVGMMLSPLMLCHVHMWQTLIP